MPALSHPSPGAPPQRLPLIPLRELVLFPHAPASIVVGRPKSIAAVQAANAGSGPLFMVTQQHPDKPSPGVDDLYQVGTIAAIRQTLHLPDGTLKLIVLGKQRAKISHFVSDSPYLMADVAPLPINPPSLAVQAMVRTVRVTLERYVKLNRSVPAEMVMSANTIDDPGRLADMIIGVLPFKLPERQELLEQTNLEARLEHTYKALLTEIDFIQVEQQLKHRIKVDRENQTRDAWLHDPMKIIHLEISDKEGNSEIKGLTSSIAQKRLPPAVALRVEKELRKLSHMNLMSAEAAVIRNYLDCIIELPWSETSTPKPRLATATGILNQDHFGLAKVKERIIEYLAVESLVERMRGPILCLVGPPGVGKTSLARSLARASHRPFVRISLGGVRDEAEIRGHRRTYIGAMPGKLIQAMQRAGTVDPVLLLDEIDKLASDIRGDPASALLEVLDPEQNATFNDHYLEVDYDLSRVTFVCTANSLQGIPPALIDRLEVIQLSGYSEKEKVAIAKRFLLPKQIALHGIASTHLVVSDDALHAMARKYTKESGVRELERQIAAVCRKTAHRLVQDPTSAKVQLTASTLQGFLGPPTFQSEHHETGDQVGLVKALAWSALGGQVLQVEAAAVPGAGKLLLTGNLGETLKESATAALTYIRSRTQALRLQANFHQQLDMHVHYPGLSTGVDGSSAGITMAVALVSALTDIPVRSDTAMTGEITLRGRVLPIGGLKDKLLAAHRLGIARVLVPEQNRKDLSEVPTYVLDDLQVIVVSHMDRVLKESLAGPVSNEIFRHGLAAPPYPPNSPA